MLLGSPLGLDTLLLDAVLLERLLTNIRGLDPLGLVSAFQLHLLNSMIQQRE